MRDETLPGVEAAFHEGEVALQRQAGVAERLARLGPQIMRDELTEQHRRFFELLPFLIVGSLGERGQPLASLLAGPPGFIGSPHPMTVRVDALPLAGDPLEQHLTPGAPLGLLGIQAHTRRRNRANGRVASRDAAGFSLAVEQSFGNCPKYITRREAIYVGSTWRGGEQVSGGLDQHQRALIARADTFYIASSHPSAARAGARSHGVDVSHRGGPPGFAHFTDDAAFTIPDFRGNDFYNTLGNLQLNAGAGLLFIDVVSGDVLQLEATATLALGSHPLAGDAGTGRVVRFDVGRVRYFPRASALRFISHDVADIRSNDGAWR